MPSSNISLALDGALLKTCRAANYYTLKRMDLTELGNQKEVYFLGENGDGKTLVLQSMVFALKWRQLKGLKATEVGKALDIYRGSTGVECAAVDVMDRRYNGIDGYSGNNVYAPLFAYGVHRGRRSSDDWDRHGVMTLFDGGSLLRDPRPWLQQIYTQELESQQGLGKAPSPSLDTVRKMIGQLLDSGLDIRVTSKEVVFIERGSELALDQLSEGYRSVLTWVLDLLARFADVQPDVDRIEQYRGIVIVDEINLHLHPKWEAMLVGKLRRWFPEVQFFFTTHSPITVMGASEDARFYKVYKEEGVTHVSEPISGKEIQSYMANNLVTSPLFDLPSARMSSFSGDEAPDTNDSFVYSRIDKEVRRRVAALRESGKVYISKADVDEIVGQVLDEFEA